MTTFQPQRKPDELTPAQALPPATPAPTLDYTRARQRQQELLAAQAATTRQRQRAVISNFISPNRTARHHAASGVLTALQLRQTHTLAVQRERTATQRTHADVAARLPDPATLQRLAQRVTARNAKLGPQHAVQRSPDGRLHIPSMRAAITHFETQTQALQRQTTPGAVPQGTWARAAQQTTSALTALYQQNPTAPTLQRQQELAENLAAITNPRDRKDLTHAVLQRVTPTADRATIQRLIDEHLRDHDQHHQAQRDQHALQRLQARLNELDDEAALHSGAALTQRIQARRGGGAPLPVSVQRQLEAGLNADLSRVRIHTDHTADQLARQLGATAFTTGQDIFFRAGRYQPNTHDGLKLIAHEATHTVQQAQGRVQGGIDPDTALEAEAQRMGEQLSAPAHPPRFGPRPQQAPLGTLKAHGTPSTTHTIQRSISHWTRGEHWKKKLKQIKKAAGTALTGASRKVRSSASRTAKWLKSPEGKATLIKYGVTVGVGGLAAVATIASGGTLGPVATMAALAAIGAVSGAAGTAAENTTLKRFGGKKYAKRGYLDGINAKTLAADAALGLVAGPAGKLVGGGVKMLAGTVGKGLLRPGARLLRGGGRKALQGVSRLFGRTGRQGSTTAGVRSTRNTAETGQFSTLHDEFRSVTQDVRAYNARTWTETKAGLRRELQGMQGLQGLASRNLDDLRKTPEVFKQTLKREAKDVVRHLSRNQQKQLARQLGLPGTGKAKDLRRALVSTLVGRESPLLMRAVHHKLAGVARTQFLTETREHFVGRAGQSLPRRAFNVATAGIRAHGRNIASKLKEQRAYFQQYGKKAGVLNLAALYSEEMTKTALKGAAGGYHKSAHEDYKFKNSPSGDEHVEALQAAMGKITDWKEHAGAAGQMIGLDKDWVSPAGPAKLLLSDQLVKATFQGAGVASMAESTELAPPDNE